MILVILMLPKSCKICIHIVVQLHINIRNKGQDLHLSSKQVASYHFYCLRMTTTWIVGEPGTLVHCKLDFRPVVAGEIHQHYCSRGILLRFIKGSSISVCSQWNYC